MLTRMALAAGLLLTGVISSGCRVAAPAYENLGGYNGCGDCGDGEVDVHAPSPVEVLRQHTAHQNA